MALHVNTIQVVANSPNGASLTDSNGHKLKFKNGVILSFVASGFVNLTSSGDAASWVAPQGKPGAGKAFPGNTVNFANAPLGTLCLSENEPDTSVRQYFIGDGILNQAFGVDSGATMSLFVKDVAGGYGDNQGSFTVTFSYDDTQILA